MNSALFHEELLSHHRSFNLFKKNLISSLFKTKSEDSVSLNLKV